MTEINKKDLKRRIKENKILTRCEQNYLIDNMEKLEKIEQIINSWDADNPRDIIHWEKMRMIEQIVKGE